MRFKEKGTPFRDLACWEALDPEGPELEQARRLYEETLAAEERIPWEWIAGAVAGRRDWRPGGWSPHLILAARRQNRSRLGPPLGFAYGIHVPDYGGYACYLGVDAAHRGRGAGTRLFQVLIQVLKVDAACEGDALPFIIWESRRPGHGASTEEWDSWRARVRLFECMGGRYVSGLTLMAPNFYRRQGPAVPLQLFVLPVGRPEKAFDVETLREAAAGLLVRVYGRGPGDRFYEETLPGSQPVLLPAGEAFPPREAARP